MPRQGRLYLLIALVAIAALIAVACGGGDEETPTATAGPQPTRPPAATTTPLPAITPTPVPTPAAERPVRGGVINVRLNTDLVPAFGWDSHRTGGYIQRKVNNTLLNGSLMLDELDHATVKADLADTLTISGDGLTYTLKYRPGVKYHDGQPFKATDVIFSYNRILGVIDTGYISPIRDLYLDYIARIEAPDDTTVQIYLKRPAPAFAMSLGHLFAVIYPERLGSEYPKDANKTPIGTGPFQFLERKPDIHIKVRRNENYFKKSPSGEQLPYLDGLDFIVIRDTFTAFSAFRAGKFLEADYLDPGLLNTQIDLIKRQFPDYTFGTGFGSWRMYAFNNRPPFNDVRIRRAMDMLVDRPGFVLARYPGYGHSGASPLLPPAIGGKWGLTDQETSTLINTGPVTPERIAQAKALFAQAGVNFETLAFKLMTLTTEVFRDDALFIQDTWKKAGLKVDMEVLEPTTLSQRRTRGEFEVYYFPATTGGDDPDLVLGRYYKSTGAENFGKFSDAKVDQWYAEQSAAVDVARRKAIAQELQRYILTDANWYPKIAWAGSWVAWSPKVRSYNAACPGADCHRGRHEITWLAPE